MSYRLNPYKILRFVVIVAFLSYAFVEFKDYIQKKNEKTNNVSKTLEIRKNDFSNSDETKKKLTGTEQNDKSNESQTVIVNTEEVKNDEVSQKEVEENKSGETPAVQSTTSDADTKKNDEQKKIVQQLEEQKKKEREALAKKAREDAAAKKNSEGTPRPVTNTGTRKYIQVATFNSESSAKRATEKLGNGFSVQAVKGTSGKTMYRIISSSTTDPDKLKQLEEQVKSNFGGGYLIRTAGK